MKAQGVKIASESSMRILSDEVISGNLAGEEVPLSQPLRFGVDLRLSPLVYIPDLISKIITLLEENARYKNCKCIQGSP